MNRPLQATLLSEPVSERDHIRGPAEARLTLVEYADFECPFCARAYPAIKDVQRRLDGQLRFVYRHFPLPDQHPHAMRAAELAEAAAVEGKFWQMHDLLFERQSALEDERLLAYARELGLDERRVKRELVQGVHRARVHADTRGARGSGVSGTPTFFINGRRHDEPGDAATLYAALRAVL